MNPRDTQEQIGLFPAFNPASGSAAVDEIRAQAVRARDEAIAAGLRRAFGGMAQAIGAIGTALLNWPERRATYESLRSLTDRELADIGLTRGDISRVFEPDFHMPSRPANANRRASDRPQAA